MKYTNGSRRSGAGRGRYGHGAPFEGRAHRDEHEHDHGHDAHEGHGHEHPHRGPGRRGGGRGGPRRGPRARRGDLRLSVLYLLAERPMHGYELMSEVTERTGGVWQPSPGSVYPTLSLLEDEGLITAESGDGSRRTFALTEAGRAAAPSADGRAPWADVVNASDPALEELRKTLRSVRVAVEQVVEAGSDEHRARTQTLLVDLRRELYLMLAGEG